MLKVKFTTEKQRHREEGQFKTPPRVAMTSGVGWTVNRRMLEDTIYEKSGPVTVLRPRHALYYIRMENWGPIVLTIYFALVAHHSFKFYRPLIFP